MSDQRFNLENIESPEINIDLNKEGKYREEIFELLKNTLKERESPEYELIRELFLTEEIDTNHLIQRIIDLK